MRGLLSSQHYAGSLRDTDQDLVHIIAEGIFLTNNLLGAPAVCSRARGVVSKPVQCAHHCGDVTIWYENTSATAQDLRRASRIIKGDHWFAASHRFMNDTRERIEAGGQKERIATGKIRFRV